MYNAAPPPIWYGSVKSPIEERVLRAKEREREGARTETETETVAIDIDMILYNH